MQDNTKTQVFLFTIINRIIWKLFLLVFLFSSIFQCTKFPENKIWENLVLVLSINESNSDSETETETKSLCDKTYFEAIQPENSAEFLSYLQSARDEGSSGAATIVPTSMNTLVGGGFKWAGGVLAPNGKIYGIPKSAGEVLIINPETNTADTTIITGLGGGTKWSGGVLAPNGKIYAIPASSTSVLIIDPETNTHTFINGLVAGPNKWNGGILAPNGKIYGFPYSNAIQNVLIIDPETDTTDTITITHPTPDLSGASKWAGGVLAPNGKIYVFPQNRNQILIIDPTSDTAEVSSITGLAGGQKYIGGVLSPDGKLYAGPFGSNDQIIIDPNTDSIESTIALAPLGVQKWWGGALAPSGKMYFVNASNTTTDFLEVNSAANTYNRIASVDTNAWNFGGAVLAPNGNIYGIPLGSSEVLVIDTKSNANYCDTVLLSGYLNKS